MASKLKSEKSGLRLSENTLQENSRRRPAVSALISK
jgi:hypothetical protein